MLSDYDTAKVQEYSFIEVIIMFFVVLYLPRNCDCKWTLFVLVSPHDDSNHKKKTDVTKKNDSSTAIIKMNRITVCATILGQKPLGYCAYNRGQR